MNQPSFLEWTAPFRSPKRGPWEDMMKKLAEVTARAAIEARASARVARAAGDSDAASDSIDAEPHRVAAFDVAPGAVAALAAVVRHTRSPELRGLLAALTEPRPKGRPPTGGQVAMTMKLDAVVYIDLAIAERIRTASQALSEAATALSAAGVPTTPRQLRGFRKRLLWHRAHPTKDRRDDVTIYEGTRKMFTQWGSTAVLNKIRSRRVR